MVEAHVGRGEARHEHPNILQRRGFRWGSFVTLTYENYNPVKHGYVARVHASGRVRRFTVTSKLACIQTWLVDSFLNKGG